MPETVIKTNDLGAFLWRGAPIALIAMIIGGLGSYWASSNQTPVYSETAVLLGTSSPGSISSALATPPQVDPRVYQKAVMEGPVAARALEATVEGAVTEARLDSFKKRIRIAIEDHRPLSSNLIRIEVRGSDQQLVALQANTLATKLIDWDRERGEAYFRSAVEALEAAIASIDSAAEGSIAIDEATAASNAARRERLVQELVAARALRQETILVSSLSQLATAAGDTRPISPRPFFNALIWAVALLVLTYGLQLVLHSHGPLVGSSERMELLTPKPMLGVLSARGNGNAGQRNRFALAQAALLASASSEKRRVFGLTSPARFGEKGSAAIGLARSFGLDGYRTVVIDGDLDKRGPEISVRASSQQRFALEDLIRDPATKIKPITLGFESGFKLDFIPVRSPAGMRSIPLARALPRALAALLLDYDVIIIDIPPLLTSRRATLLAAMCSGVVLVSGASSSLKDTEEALRVSELTSINIVGTLFAETGWRTVNPQKDVRLKRKKA